MLAAAVVVCAPAWLSAESLKIRIAWGGGSERIWQGKITLSEGRLDQPCPLGIEADEPGSMWIQDGALVVRQRSPRTYDGLDLMVLAPLSAKLTIQLASPGETKEPGRIEVPLSSLLEGFHNADLDSHGNRLLIRRAPDDKLRVELGRRSLVFAPGETIRLDVAAHLLAADPGTKIRLTTALLAGRGTQELAAGREDQATLTAEQAPVPVEIVLPKQEGVYDLVITANRSSALRLPQSSRLPLNWNKPLAQRRIQVMVLDGQSPPAAGETAAPQREMEIDPANPRWWERFSKLPHGRRLRSLGKGPLGNDRLRPVSHPLGELAQLAPAASPGDVSWEAYLLSIEEPGQPHVLEVDYPSDVPQTMGISIIEPNAAGAVLPIGLDSGVDQAEEVVAAAGPPQMLHHRVIFWPRTKTPVVLITNRRDRVPAVYGKIRVLRIGPRLPRAFPAGGPRPQRLLAAYFDRPLFPENFSATQTPGPMSDLGVDDWVTFYEGGTRLVDYLNHVGYNGLVIAALADGSTIYPSEVLGATPRYDTGLFLETGQDPVRKDVLEMLLRLFDREGLQLIPALEFGAPLPELEALLRRGGPEAEGITWVGPDGLTWLETYPPVRGMAPYYNVLHPRVQQAMLAVVHELVARYARHPSFGGLAIQLALQGYAQLPGPEWGLDDITIARFERDTQIRVPGTDTAGVAAGANGASGYADTAGVAAGASGYAVSPGGHAGRFAQRARFLADRCPREWLQWRADQLGRFHGRIQQELAAFRPDARVLLTAASLFAGDPWQRELRPSLPQRMTMTEALMRVGIDLRRLGRDDGLILLRPERVEPRWSLAQQAVNLELRDMPDINRCFQELPVQGSLFFHQPQEVRVASFDEKSPFQPAYTWLATQAVPSHRQNRRRFVHSLATLDPQMMVDGGWELSLGQEDSLGDLVAAYRRLPAIHFRRLADLPGGPSTQPVTIRVGGQAQSTYVYLANDAPFATTVGMDVAAPPGCRVEELSGRRQVPPLARQGDAAHWTLDLEPYDLVAVRFGAPQVQLLRPQVTWSPAVQAALETRLAELGDRAAALRNPPLMEVLDNPGFERAGASGSPIAGWSVSNQPGTSVTIDSHQRHGGLSSARLSSPGPVTTLISQPFAPPTTGRLTISVWLRGADALQRQSPRLRLAVVGKHQGRDFLRFAELGQAGSPGIGPVWSPVVVQVNDLPLDGLSQLQLRFDLLGQGQVWLDDIQLCQLAFSKSEVIEMFKLIAPADVKLQQGEVGDCVELLESYWPRFLMANVAPGATSLTRKTDVSRPSAAAPREQPERSASLMDRVKSMFPTSTR
jgi:hypothetical protein